MINIKVLAVFLALLFMIMSMPMSVFADEDGEVIKEEMPNAGSLEGFWMRYDPEDIGYHVVDPMEKICILGDEEPLKIQITKEENNESLSDHFLEVTVTNIYTSFEDMNKLFYESCTTPEYEMSEEDGILTFIFSKDIFECPKDFKRYEFVFTFDDGKAYSLVWVTKENDMLEYTESGHVWFIPAPIVTLEDMGITEPTYVYEESKDSVPVNIIEGEKVDEKASNGNYTWLIIIGCVIIVAIVAFVIYRFAFKSKGHHIR